MAARLRMQEALNSQAEKFKEKQRKVIFQLGCLLSERTRRLCVQFQTIGPCGSEFSSLTDGSSLQRGIFPALPGGVDGTVLLVLRLQGRCCVPELWAPGAAFPWMRLFAPWAAWQ